MGTPSVLAASNRTRAVGWPDSASPTVLNQQADLLIALSAVASSQRRVRRRQVQVDHHVWRWQASVRRLRSHGTVMVIYFRQH